MPGRYVFGASVPPVFFDDRFCALAVLPAVAGNQIMLTVNQDESADPIRLALETSTRGGSLATYGSHGVRRHTRLPSDQRSASTLLPAIERLVAPSEDRGSGPSEDRGNGPSEDRDKGSSEDRDKDPSEGDAAGLPVKPRVIAVADGPGSFTGLRIAITAAKTLAYAWGATLVTVDTLAAAAAAAMVQDPHCDQVDVVLNAYRGQLFVGRFDRRGLFAIPESADSMATGSTVRVENADDLDRTLVRQPSIRRITDAPAIAADVRLEELNLAIGVAHLALLAESAGRTVDPAALVPRYLKLSAAEEKRAASADA